MEAHGMRISLRAITIIAAFTVFFWQLCPSLADETVYKITNVTVVPQAPVNGVFPKIVTFDTIYYLSYPQESATLPCKWGDPFNFKAATCPAALASVHPEMSFKVYRTEEIDSKLDDIGQKLSSLNKRMAGDEAALPSAIDQYAVQKLLEKIDGLEARIKVLENQNRARQ
jgi:hypothetical protein